jgi:hypothetical protein
LKRDVGWALFICVNSLGEEIGFTYGFEVLKAIISWGEIWYTYEGVQNRPSNFFGAKKVPIVASKWGSKGKTLPLDCEQLERSTKLKFCRKLHSIENLFSQIGQLVELLFQIGHGWCKMFEVSALWFLHFNFIIFFV